MAVNMTYVYIGIAIALLLVILAIVVAAVYGFVKAFFKYGGEFRKGKNNFIIVFFPWFMYSAFSVAAGVFNVLLNDIIPYRTNEQKTNWADASHTVEQSVVVGEKRIEEIKSQIIDNYPESYPEAELVQLFDTLAPATSEELYGNTYKNKIVDVAELSSDNYYERLAKFLSKGGVHVHRRFQNKYEGDSILVNVLDLCVFPLPVFGNVGLRELNFRGKVNPTMVYDHQPWADHIRVLDADKKIYLAFATCRDRGNGFYTLTFRPEIETR